MVKIILTAIYTIFWMMCQHDLWGGPKRSNFKDGSKGDQGIMPPVIILAIPVPSMKFW